MRSRLGQCVVGAGMLLTLASFAMADGETGKTWTCHANCGTGVTVNCATNQMGCCCPSATAPVTYSCSCMSSDCNGNTRCEGSNGNNAPGGGMGD